MDGQVVKVVVFSFLKTRLYSIDKQGCVNEVGGESGECDVIKKVFEK